MQPAYTIRTPAPISSLAYAHSGHIFTGSDDGVLRVYRQSGSKVLKAISGLGCEISSIVSAATPEAELGTVWIASGGRIHSFELDSHTHKMILTRADAAITFQISADGEDVLNELALSSNRKYLAFSLDTGVVGVVDLNTSQVSQMKVKHDNICGTVAFIPNRPSELVSGGYDQTILHFDFLQCKLLSRRNLAALPLEGGMTLSPPFVLSTSLSSTGILAASTADGRLWLGSGGEPTVSGGKKRKWNGLREEDGWIVQAAEGPIVAVVFADPSTLVICTLLGRIKQYHISREGAERGLELEEIWSVDAMEIAKVNAMIVNGNWIAIGGLGKEGQGIVEVWNQDASHDVTG